MRLRHLEIFHAVMRTGSVTGAAALLKMSQSAASKALAQAEHGLGLSLFRRVNGRLVHTREAEQLYASTIELFAQVDSVARLAAKLKRNPEDHLRIGCLPSLSLGLIPDTVTAFRARFPGVSMEIITGNGDELVNDLIGQQLDVVICYEMPAHPVLASLPLGEIPIVHVAARGTMHDRHRSDSVRFEDLDPAHWIGIGGSDPLAQLIRECWSRLQGDEQDDEPVAAVESRTYYVAAALARSGNGFAIVDELTARAIAHNMSIRRIEPWLAIRAVAFQVSARQSSVPLKGFVEALRAQFARLRATA